MRAPIAAVLGLILLVAGMSTPVNAVTQSIVISEVKLGGGTDTPKEFVELYNSSDLTVDMFGWTVEYAKTGFLKTNCNTLSWQLSTSGSLARTIELKDIIIAPRGSVVIEISLTDNKSGSLRLLATDTTGDNQLVDMVGWGPEAPCFQGELSAPMPTSGKSIKRAYDHDGHPINTLENSKDFTSNHQPTPFTTPFDCLYTDGCTEEENENNTETDIVEKTSPSCDGLVISKILPDPASPLMDADDEFIELFNPTLMPIELHGCSVQTSYSSKTYALPSIIIAPESYERFYSGDLQFTLPNKGGSVTLISQTTEAELQYPAVHANEILEFKNGAWVRPVEGDSEVTDIDVPSYVPCDEGEERNPSTNRCRKIISGASSILTACAVGSVRNPETNRCRKSTSEGTGLTPCAPGQERNPATNRCRKVVAVLSGIDSKKAVNPSTAAVATGSENWMSWWISGAILSGVFGYGIYEWRQELKTVLQRFRSKLKFFDS